MVYSHLGHCSLEGNLQVPHLASPPGICLLSTFNNYIPPSFTDITLWQNMPSLWKNRQVGKGHGSLVGNLNICSQLHWHKLPCNSQAELSFISSLKVWRDIQKPCYDIAYLLVWVENDRKDRHYGISIVWVNPNQVRAATMKEAVKKLTACTSSGIDWPYTLAQLYKGPCHAPLPKDGHLGILPQRGVEDTPCGQISLLKVCQLLAASPQVVYPVGLNGHDEPIITTLPELLASSVSLTASKHIYLEIDIPSPPVEELDQKILSLGKVSTILIASPHKSPPKLEGSVTKEVSNLLSWAVLEVSSWESKHSSPRRPTPAVVLTTPPWEPEVNFSQLRPPLWQVLRRQKPL